MITAIFADYDRDGDTDLLMVPRDDGSVALMQNDGAGNLKRISTGPVGSYRASANSVSWADVDVDGDLDVLITSDRYPASVYIFASCDEGARTAAGSGCFACPSYMRRGGVIDVCYECAPDRITGGVPSEAGCTFPCADGFERQLGNDTCTICPAGTYWDATIDRDIDVTSPRCLPTLPGTYADGVTPAIGGGYACRAGSYSPSDGSGGCTPCSPGTYTEADSQSVCVNCEHS